MGHHHEHQHGEHCDHSHQHPTEQHKHSHAHTHQHNHAHSHDHAHHHHFDIQELSFKLILGAALNFIFVGVEAAAGFYFDSVALLADASHNLSDAGSLLLALLAFHWAKIPASASHNFGYQKTTILAALFNSALLVAALCVLAYQSVGRFWQLPTAVFGLETAAVAGLGIIINSATAFLLLSNQKDDLNLRGAYLHMVADALVSLGVLLSGVLVYFTQWAWVDAVVSLLIVLLLFRSSWALLAQSWRLSLGAVPDGISWDKIKAEIQQLAHIDKVLELQIWALSSSENTANLKISFQDGCTISQIAQVQHQIQHLLEHHQIQKSNIEIVFHTQKSSHQH